MANRILVNTLNEDYNRITTNLKGSVFGLGIRSTITPDVQAISKANEIYFTREELENKRRKLKITLDTFTTPEIFTSLVAEAADRNAGGQWYEQNLAPVGGTVKNYIVETFKDQFKKELEEEKAAAEKTSKKKMYVPEDLSMTSTFGNTDNYANSDFPDSAARWYFTKKDFVAVNGAARAESPNRSIITLYDDRNGVGGFNVSTREALCLLAREAVADSLFAISGTDVAIPGPDHPGPQGNGTADRNLFGKKDSWTDKNKLFEHFPIREYAGSTYRTHAKLIAYILKYINLIDSILNLQDSTLSRAVDTTIARVEVPISIKLSTVRVDLSKIMQTAMERIVTEKVYTFLDDSREYKTILNFGNDQQYLIEAWRQAPGKTNAVQFKLFSPLQSGITLYQSAFISREVAKSVIDQIEFELGPAADTTPYLRPYNMDGLSYSQNKYVNKVTIESLGMLTGSRGAVTDNKISYDDVVFRRWFTDGFNASELNIDFSDYKNFVYYGSAYNRLLSFKNKLKKIEELDTYSTATNVTSNIGASLKAIEKENIIRGFDSYEQFLYYNTSSVAYSASADYADYGTEYNISGSWPKQVDGKPYSPSSVSASNWLTIQEPIAQRYDEFNQNYLVKHLPSYVQEDVESGDFTLFVGMFGHLMDNLKVYIDQFPNIYSTNPNPFEDLTMDQVYEVAQSFGLQLPNAYALQNLQNFAASLPGDTGTRSTVAEIWKRFLHSMVYLNKIKGSRTSFDALLNTYGLSAPIVQVKETTYPVNGNYVKSEELTYGLTFESASNSHIVVPFNSSSVAASCIQIRFNPDTRKSTSLVTGDLKWAIDLIPHPSGSSTQDIVLKNGTTTRTIVTSNKQSYGKIHIVSGSARTVIASSDYFPLFSDDYTNIMLRSESQDLAIVQTDGEQILYRESASVNLSGLWESTQFVYVGSSGSIKLDNFDGVVDEVRVWGENISIDDFLSQSMDPGSYYGTNYTSSYENLYVHVTFNQPLSSITQSVINESPYKNISSVSTLSANGFTTSSYTRVLRTIAQFTPIIGTTTYSNSKIKIAPPPVFGNAFIDSTGTINLQKNVSIKPIQDKRYTSGLNVVSVGISPTDFTNQIITRTMGIVDVNKLIGSPRYSSEFGYTNLEEIKNKFLQYYNKTISPNEYTRFFKDLVEASGEMASMTAPAKAKVLSGIVIESPILNRTKSRLYKKLNVSGQDTKALTEYLSGSVSAQSLGAYTGEAVFDVHAERVITSDINLLSASIILESTTKIKSSTPPSKIPTSRVAYQYLNLYDNASLATSSINDENSSFGYIEANNIDTRPRAGLSSSYDTPDIYPISQSGNFKKQPYAYARNPFLGTDTRIPSEEGTLIPIYDIPPRSDFNDVGTTTYFHKDNGIYSYAITTTYKTPYLVKLVTNVDYSLDRLFAPITLLNPTTLPNIPSRDTATIPFKTYSSGSQTNTGVIKAANILSLYGVQGTAGLRIRLYRTADALQADVARNFSTSPSVNSGVLFDAVLDGNQDVYPATLMHTVDSNIYYNIDNTTSTNISTHIDLEYFAYEPANLQPAGYLPRHYRFSRDNGTGIRRRNFIGTQYTDELPPAGCPDDWDDCPPFQWKPTETNQMTVLSGDDSFTNPLTFVN